MTTPSSASSSRAWTWRRTSPSRSTGDRLSVRGERRDEQTGEGFRQSRYGSFRRSFTLPGHVDADAVSASYDAGVLTVRVTGAHAAATEPGARRIAIDGVPAAEETESTEAPPEAPAA